jgi:eukaryotic-like serine/threonine-protein kinase
VAVKLLRSGFSDGAHAAGCFYAEAEAVAKLDHPNIIKVFEIGEFQGQPFYSMEWIEGQDLRQRLAEFSEPTEARANRRLVWHRQMKIAALMAKLARAVDFAHKHGVIHGDLKPAKILLDHDDDPHLGHFFGVPEASEEEDDDDCDFHIKGTLTYMSPEQASGKKRWTYATDVYSLGAMLYHLLCGRAQLAHRHINSAVECEEILREIREVMPTPPRVISPRIDPDLEAICLKCLAKDPAHRYASAEDLALDLERWQRGEALANVRTAGQWARWWIRSAMAVR